MDERADPSKRDREGHHERFASLARRWRPASDVRPLSLDLNGTVVNVLLVATLLMGAASVTFAVTQPGDQYSEFYLLTDDERGGLDAGDYPVNLTRGESTQVIVGISNHERETIQYTVITKFQRVQFTGDTNVTVVEEREGERVNVSLAPEEVIHAPYVLRPPISDEQIRIRFLLFAGEPPADPTVGNAYREIHLWANISANGGA